MNNIKTALQDKGISQVWLAEKLGKSKSTVNNWCCQVYDPNINQLKQIALLLGIDWKRLV